MKPYIICHMMESVDGRIDCDMTEQIEPSDVYYEALDKLNCPTTLEGRVSMQKHFAKPEPFAAGDATPVGKTAYHKATEAAGYSIAVDTMGKLQWPSSSHYGTPFLVITSEACAKEYLDGLTRQGISWIAAGKEGIDLAKAVDILNTEFGVERMAVVGGGHINAAFMAAGLLDEVSIMVGPGIDGRKGMAGSFDGIGDSCRPATLLSLTDLQRMGDTVWMRYTFRK